ncbi:MAG: hypothetical protein A3A81_03875 [Omnitrophica bacterium RIFCSPLOWO2_01_FULL_45_10b]|nr:MAG: hypothetical protein A3A81_03875 [Omnitrophica bacterium RIFCSPLOWO2_01_FULL_45_10b]
MNKQKKKVTVCYCQIPMKKLIELVRMRFVENIQTEELMKRMNTDQEREYLATVALLDVSDQELVSMIEAGGPVQPDHLLACRQRAKNILKDYAVILRAEGAHE